MNKEPENKANTSQFLKTDGGKTKSNTIEIPSISLPKGGGAIKGIDEKFSVNAVNGTASFSIPLPFSPARGASPALSLSYNSGSGNGVFGLGWNLSLSSIRRKTDKGLPQYIDSKDSDTFLFSETEDLVTEFEKIKKTEGSFEFIMDEHGNYCIHEKNSPDNNFKIRFYKPRIEGLFARIERWTEITSGIISWRVITKENVTTLFGWSDNATIVDPTDGTKIFEWLPEFVFDDKGNCSHYIYKKDDEIGFDTSLLYNRNRHVKGKINYTNRYLEKVLYGNQTPYKKFGDLRPSESNYLFSTVFDYGSLKKNDPVDQINDWDYRTDAFSDYKAGFEIRTTRLCKRVLLYHHFTGANEYDGLVKSIDFGYDNYSQNDFTFLKSITACGYIKTGLKYIKKELPATELEYQKHDWNTTVKTISAEDLVHAPSGLDEQQSQFTDLFNEGLSGILTEQANGWFYKHNLGDGKFEQAELVTPKPSFIGLGRQFQLADLDADGGKQLVSYNTEPKGYFELDDNNEWQLFKTFQNLPNIDFGEPNARMLDLNGDGRPEVLITEDTVFTWYLSDGRKGFSQVNNNPKPIDEEAGPYMVFADPQQTIFLADMSGDGMTDIVRIRNGEVCYWPNLGYGKFGAKVAMDNAPLFDRTDSYNPAFLRLADIDGSGTTDIIYLGKNKFIYWLNLNGNSFTAPFEIDVFPEIDNHAKITVTDLLGTGVSCIVWSSNLSKDAQTPLKYIDLMNSKKPHIMVKYWNNLGKEVSMEYTPSTKFYIEDKLAGKPWITKLHFPVHCISKIETVDKISDWHFVSSYKYHHGYYDHPEREFRGFGMVEQTDAEFFGNWAKGDASNIVEEDLHQAPVTTKTWFHTGAFLGRKKILTQFAHEYWYEEMASFSTANHEVPLPDAMINVAPDISNTFCIDQLSSEEWQEALRACKSMALRSEVFAHDAPANNASAADIEKQLTPYSAATHNCVIELLQPKGQNKHAIFIVKESEAINYNYERDTENPRIAHTLNIKLDEYGNVLESASVVYPKIAGIETVSSPPPLPLETQQAQSKTIIIYTENQFTKDVIGDDVYRLRLPSETKSYELKDVTKKKFFFEPGDFNNILNTSSIAEYHEVNKEPNGTSQKRLIEHLRTTYRNNNLIDPLPFGTMDSLGITHESYQLAYTKELLHEIYSAKKGDAKLVDLMIEGKFVPSDGNTKWWIPSGTTNFIDSKNPDANTLEKAQARFYLPVSYTDPYESITKVKYDSNYFLFIQETEDELGNKATLDLFNFRTLSPQRMKDANDNLSEAITDELGLVKAVAVMGKDNNNDGIGEEADNLIGLEEITENELSDIGAFFQIANAEGICKSSDLQTTARQLLKNASTRFIYDFDAYRDKGKPVVVASITREQHFKDNPQSPIQLSFEYSNGLGKVIMKKVQAEPGEAKQITIDADNHIFITKPDPDTKPFLRWIGNGRTILNNKGNAVKQYEPFFSVSPKFEDEKELVETGVTPIMYYDAMGRLIKTKMPNGTFSKVVFDSWQQTVYDANDTVMDSDWYKKRIDPQRPDYVIDANEHSAAVKAFAHNDTPSQLHFDTLGRPVLQVEHNRDAGKDSFFNTKIELDVEGNLRKVTDARENPVMEYKYDMLGNKVYQKSMDAGQRWLMINIAGNPLRTWDERDHEFQYYYDKLHRPTCSIVINEVGKPGDEILNHIFEKIIYGESLLDDARSNETDVKSKNLLGKPILHFDTAGLTETPEYDFKGQPKSTTRKLFSKYKEVANWTDANIEPVALSGLLDGDSFTFITETDALGRITKQTAPDESIITPSYNEAGLLNGETVTHVNPAIETTYIIDIDYNEKGQRNKIIYGNDVTTKYEYDKETFRLIRLETKRQNGKTLQDLCYTYDPVGNILRIEDKAGDTTFFKNMKVEPICEYVYDALYRLTEATGRENGAALDFATNDNWNDTPKMQLHQPGDPMAVIPYTQSYTYDEVGNIKEMNHHNKWTRGYEYAIDSNRLLRTKVGQGSNTYPFEYPPHLEHGYITKLPHLINMGWNFKEELIFTTKQNVTAKTATPETTYYQYDGSGQRIRKITENYSATDKPTKKDERIYIAGYETYRTYSSNAVDFERESLSLMDKEHRFVMVETVKPKYNPLVDELRRTIRYQLHNHLGSACIELSENAEVISYEEYHPYGTTAYQATNKTIKTIAKRYRYTGMERDEETGLEYHSARYYAAWLGRWCSCDPKNLIDGLNVFKYSSMNPINNIDLTGMQCYPTIKSCTSPADGGSIAISQDKSVTKTMPNNHEHHDAGVPTPNNTRAPVEDEIAGFRGGEDLASTDKKMVDAHRAVNYVRSNIKVIGNCLANFYDERVKAMSPLNCIAAALFIKDLRDKAKPLSEKEQMELVNLYEAKKRQSISYDEKISLLNYKLLEDLVEPTIKYNIGNCGEHAQLALKFLIDNTESRPLEMVTNPGRTQYNFSSHNYVLIGRTKGNLLDPSSWNKDTVICDPYKDHVYSIGEMGELGDDQKGIKETEACVNIAGRISIRPPNDTCYLQRTP